VSTAVNRVLAIVLLLGLALPASATAQDSLEAKRREIDTKQREARENRARAKELRGRETQAVGQLRQTDRALRGSRARLQNLSRRRKNLGQQLEMTRGDLQLSIQSLGGARERLRRRLRSIYKMGPARELEVMLSQQSFAQLMAEALAATAVSPPTVPLVANVTAAPIGDPTTIRRLLVEQVTAMVRWRETVLAMKAADIDTLVELGAGKVLSGLCKRIDADVQGISVGTPAEVEALLRTF